MAEKNSTYSYKDRTQDNKRANFVPLVIYSAISVTICIFAYFIIKYGLLIMFSIFSNSEYFEIKKIVVECADENIKEEIILLSGLDKGQSLLKQNLKDLKSRIMRHPNVVNVKIKRQFPNTLTIYLTTRTPIAVAMLDKLYYLDQNGVPYKPVGLIEECDLPIITGVMDDNAQETDRRLKFMVNVLKDIITINSNTFTFEISEIHYKSDRFVLIYPKEPKASIRVYVPELAQEFKRIGQAMAYVKAHGLASKLTEVIPHYNDGVAILMGKGL